MVDAYGEDAARLVRETLFHVRCVGCEKLLAEMVSTPYRLRCPRCKKLNHAGVPGQANGSGSSSLADENVSGNSTTSA
jgi:phage FluMu protein Com